MNKTAIEWCDYTVNPVKGLCPVACPYCYARRMYKRFHWDESIRFDNSLWNEAPKIRKPSRIFVGSTMELFGPWVDPEWMRLTLNAVKAHPQHTFIFLTKRPHELRRYNPWPGNCWVGATATNGHMLDEAGIAFGEVQCKVRFLSLEPLQERLLPYFRKPGLSWVIMGQQTPVREPIPLEWVASIAEAATNADIPVFLKDNLNSCEVSDYPVLLDAKGNLRQEWPA